MWRRGASDVSTDTTRDTVFGIAIMLTVAAVLLGFGLMLWSSGRTNAEKSLQTQLACIQAGGTWVGAGNTCVIPTIR